MDESASCQQPEAHLLAALRTAPHRYRMPPLPADADAAVSEGTETALAFAIEAARAAKQRHLPAPPHVQDLFTRSLAELIGQALAPERGDSAFRALLLRAQVPQVDEYAGLSAHLAADGRAVRAATDAFAHPGKMRNMARGAKRDALSRMHSLVEAGSWTQLVRAIDQLLAQELDGHEVLRDSLGRVRSSPALKRLERGSALLGLEAVQRYRALCEQRGPLAGSHTAATQGRASARLGDVAEHATVRAFREIAELLNRRTGGTAPFRVVRSLRTPRGYPGESGKAKEEWDAAIVRSTDDAGATDIVLLAEVKASPAAAAPDFSRLHRGLQRLAHGRAHESYVFASADGEVRIHGESLRRLQPDGRSLPPHVIYCCSAPAESPPQMLSAVARAVLLVEPASLAFAHRLTRGESPRHADLAPVWDALMTLPRLRSALHQYETACAVRESMLDPEDLLASVARRVQSTPRT